MKKRLAMLSWAAIVSLLFGGCPSDKRPTKSAAPSAAVNLTGTQWKLEELSGKPAIVDSRATLTFPEAGKVAGNGSCNRFTGAAKVNGGSLQLGPLVSTRMMCEGGPAAQETDYLKALEGASRFAVKDGKLYVYVSGAEKPLVFAPVK